MITDAIVTIEKTGSTQSTMTKFSEEKQKHLPSDICKRSGKNWLDHDEEVDYPGSDKYIIDKSSKFDIPRTKNVSHETLTRWRVLTLKCYCVFSFLFIYLSIYLPMSIKSQFGSLQGNEMKWNEIIPRE